MRVAMALLKAPLKGAVVCLAVVVGCDGQTSFLERFVDACSKSSNMPQEVCECLGRTAQTDLTPEVRTFLLTSLEGDADAIEEARNQLGAAQTMQAGIFMTQAGDCARELEQTGASAPSSADGWLSPLPASHGP